ncbi:50S ribosomal protein L24 [Candidatus Pacearchaeota archaeon]|nr:MAG: 50S ribosomal protein L24 [Candidatus Pacearchaeota archaeon]
MKKEFVKNWKSSKQPRKQRKYLANAPISIKKKFLSVNLSKELREKYKKRNIPVRKGDVVKIMRGKFKGKKAKIIQVSIKNSKVIIENIQVKKRDGSNANIKFQPSNLQITELNLEDKKRVKKLTKSNTKSEEKSK